MSEPVFTRADVELIQALLQALERAQTAEQLLVEFTVIHPEPWEDLARRIQLGLPSEGESPP